MNSEELYKLQELARDKSILYVEDSVTLQKQAAKFLSKIFNKFFQAYNGEEGYRKFIKYKPDLVLTDLTMPKKSGLDMIVAIKEVQTDAKIIVLSAHNDDLTLLRTIDLGIVEFLLKPINLDKLTISLTEAIINDEHINQKNKCIHDLKIIFEQKTHFELINSYKGIPVINEGHIVDLNKITFTVKISQVQMYALKNENHCVLRLKEINRHIHADIQSRDPDKNEVVLSNPRYINFSLSEFNYKRIVVDKNFKVGIHYHNKTVNVRPIDISLISICSYIDNRNLQLKLNDTIEITLGFELEMTKTPYFLGKEFKKAFAKGKILKLQAYKTGYLLTSSLHVNKSDESTFQKYIHTRKKEIKNEFNSLLKSTI